MVADTDVCDSVAGSPGRPDEVLDKDMQVPARCGAAGTLTPGEHGSESSFGSAHSEITSGRRCNEYPSASIWPIGAIVCDVMPFRLPATKATSFVYATRAQYDPESLVKQLSLLALFFSFFF